MKRNRLYASLVMAGILCSCANELPLTGGDKDTKPPVAEKFDPPNQSPNFTSKKIVIEFDEYVKLKDATKQILISPPGTEFEVVEKGKSIQLTITSTLRENTTYVVNFGSSVVDNNEGNVLSDLVYTFSTGPILDSLKTYFNVVDAYTLKPVPKVEVMLYSENVDSLPLTTLPYYTGTTDEKGKVTIRYMRPGLYKVFAISEESRNYKYDKPNELIGYLDYTVNAGDSVYRKVLFFKEDAANAKIQSAKMPIAGMVTFKFTGNVDKEQIRVISKNHVLDTSNLEFMNGRRDTAVYWFQTKTNDTLQLQFSRKKGELDTTKVYPKVLNTYKNNQVNGVQPFKITTTYPFDFDYYKRVEFEFNYPVDSMGFDTIRITEEGKKIPAILIPVDGVQRKYYLDYNFKQSKNYTIYFPRRSVKSIFGNYLDSTVVSFKTSNEKAYKTLTLEMKNPEKKGSGILQLLNDKDEVLDVQTVTWSDSTVAVFPKLRQGSYRVRLIYDENNNGKWDSGNYAEKRQPEKVVYFPQNIDIKPTFDYVLEWDMKKED